MVRVAAGIVEPALLGSEDPLAADLLDRLRQEGSVPVRATATRPFDRRAALAIYQRKAAKGDRNTVRTEGYPRRLSALATSAEPEVIVHGVAFADTVYLVITDAARRHCVGMLRKWRTVER